MSSLIAIVHGDGAPVGLDILRDAIDGSQRGPDRRDAWSGGPVGLAHGLLEVGGGAPAAQPATLDGRLWIAADARIDDREALIAELETVGDRRSPGRSGLRAAADHQLLLHAYRAWSRRCVAHLKGDFAFAIWDAGERTLFCARDHFGVAPLFYAALGDRLIIASELDLVRSFPGVPDRLDDLAVADYLMFGYSQEPEATIFAAIRRLPAAHTLTWKDGRIRIERYWELEAPQARQYSEGDPVGEFEQVLQAAIDDRLRDTSKAGISFSGGIDSTVVAALAQQASGLPELRAVTVVFDHLIPDDEGHYAAIAAAALGIAIEQLPADHYRPFEDWRDPARRPPEPVIDPRAAVNVDLMRSLAAHGRVALTGHDGDALLWRWLPSHFWRLIQAGTPLRAASEVGQLARLTGFPPRGATGILGQLLRRRRRRRAALAFPPWIAPELAESLDLRERWLRVQAPEQSWSRLPEADAVEQLTGPRLRYELHSCDPVWTHVAVDVRHPLLDLRVVEHALALPPIPWTVGKAILRRIASPRLPPSIVRRPKAGLREDPLRPAALAAPLAGGEGISASQTARYVNPDLLPPIRSAAASDALWPRLWATGLDLWLRRQECHRHS